MWKLPDPIEEQFAQLDARANFVKWSRKSFPLCSENACCRIVLFKRTDSAHVRGEPN
jgi:hypothetical protein